MVLRKMVNCQYLSVISVRGHITGLSAILVTTCFLINHQIGLDNILNYHNEQALDLRNEQFLRESLMNQSRDAFTKRLPQCIIIGVRKAGTRALITFLNLHPEIVIAEREAHFFNNKDGRYWRGLEYYRDRMPRSWPNQITIEKTPKYLFHDDAPARIAKMNASIKLILIVRDPVDRMISEYVHSGVESKSFEVSQREFVDTCR